MIVTVTLNPAVDQTAWVERLDPGAVHRVIESNIDPAGKGINVSRMAHRLGWPTIAFGFLAGDTGNIIRKALEHEGVQLHFVRTAGQTRVNLTVVDGSGTERLLERSLPDEKVFQLRPARDWDKGKALLWLLDATGQEDAFPIYVGDDTTDEDAFAAVVARGLGVLVTDLPRPTAARYSLQDPFEVRLFLERLAQGASEAER